MDSNLRPRIPVLPYLLILLCCVTVDAQEKAVKLDDLVDLRTSDAKAHLDIFAERLSREPGSKGVLVAFCPRGWQVGAFLRTAHGYLDYLVNSRGIPPNQIKLEFGENGTSFRVELWLLPANSVLPVSTNTNLLQFKAVTLFDSLLFGPDCVSQYTLTLEEPEDVSRFFGSALQQNPALKGLMIVYPARSRNDREGKSIFAASRSMLIKDNAITADRLITSFAHPRQCGELQMWLVPSSFAVPTGQTADSHLRSALMSEADSRYSVRRVEFVGIRYTRDHFLRREMPGLQEGEVFTIARLRESLALVNRLSIIHPIRIRDVDVSLDRADSAIDLVLSFRERPRAALQNRERR